MAVLLLGEVTNGELSRDATAKAEGALKALSGALVSEAHSLRGLALVLVEDQDGQEQVGVGAAEGQQPRPERPQLPIKREAHRKPQVRVPDRRRPGFRRILLAPCVPVFVFGPA